MRYYVKISGKAFGPFPEEKLRAMIQQGRIKRESEISTEGKDWFPAERAGFFDEQSASAGGVGGQATGLSHSGTEMGSVKEWFLSHDGKSGTGPYAASEIEAMINTGAAGGGALVWRQGENARPLSEEPIFFGRFRAVAQPSSAASEKSRQGLPPGFPQSFSEDAPFDASYATGNESRASFNRTLKH